MTSESLIILAIHIFVLVLWMADSRAMDYVIQKFRYRRSMPQPAEIDEENPFIIDQTKEKEKVDTKFEEMIKTAYGNSPSRWDAWGGYDKNEKPTNLYRTNRSLEPLLDSLLEELEKAEPEIYKSVLMKHFFRNKRKRPNEEGK